VREPGGDREPPGSIAFDSRLFERFGLGGEDRAAWTASSLPAERFDSSRDWMR
jgi:hypothetical protein